MEAEDAKMIRPRNGGQAAEDAVTKNTRDCSTSHPSPAAFQQKLHLQETWKSDAVLRNGNAFTVCSAKLLAARIVEWLQLGSTVQISHI